MGYSKPRKRKTGTRWTAYVEALDGRVRSAGTYATKDGQSLRHQTRGVRPVAGLNRARFAVVKVPIALTG